MNPIFLETERRRLYFTFICEYSSIAEHNLRMKEMHIRQRGWKDYVANPYQDTEIPED